MYCLSKPSSQKSLSWLFSSIVIILLDQLIKLIIFRDYSNLSVLNYGISFGILRSHLWLIINLLVVLVLIRILKNELAKGLIIGGAVSNLLDRLIRGGVVDYIRLGILPVFNLADIVICLGIILLAYRILIN